MKSAANVSQQLRRLDRKQVMKQVPPGTETLSAGTRWTVIMKPNFLSCSCMTPFHAPLAGEPKDRHDALAESKSLLLVN